MIAYASKAYSGFYGPVLPGANSPNGMARKAPSIAGSSKWAESGTLLNLWRAFLNQLSERQKVRWDECFIDGMFIRAKKGARWSRRLKAVRKQSLWYWPMAQVLRWEYTW